MLLLRNKHKETLRILKSFHGGKTFYLTSLFKTINYCIPFCIPSTSHSERPVVHVESNNDKETPTKNDHLPYTASAGTRTA